MAVRARTGLLAVGLAAVPAASADWQAMADGWDSNIALTTGIDFPDRITCFTEKVFSCHFDTDHCQDDFRDYRPDYPAQSWHFDFPQMRVTMDKGAPDLESEGELRYLGGTTYHMSLDRFPNLAGWVASFSRRDKQVQLTWYVSSSLGIAIQGHTGHCVVEPL